jgi:hypothetical protein
MKDNTLSASLSTSPVRIASPLPAASSPAGCEEDGALGEDNDTSISHKKEDGSSPHKEEEEEDSFLSIAHQKEDNGTSISHKKEDTSSPHKEEEDSFLSIAHQKEDSGTNFSTKEDNSSSSSPHIKEDVSLNSPRKNEDSGMAQEEGKCPLKKANSVRRRAPPLPVKRRVSFK